MSLPIKFVIEAQHDDNIDKVIMFSRSIKFFLCSFHVIFFYDYFYHYTYPHLSILLLYHLISTLARSLARSFKIVICIFVYLLLSSFCLLHIKCHTYCSVIIISCFYRIKNSFGLLYLF